MIPEEAVGVGSIRTEEHQVRDHHCPEVAGGGVGRGRAAGAGGRGEPVLEGEQGGDEEERQVRVGPCRHGSRPVEGERGGETEDEVSVWSSPAMTWRFACFISDDDDDGEI